MSSNFQNVRDFSEKSLSLLVGGIAHDLNNILTMITGTLSMNILDLDDSMELKNDLKEALSATNRATKLTNQLLRFSKGGVPIKTSASSQDIVIDSTNLILSGSQIKVLYSISAELPKICCDSDQISQVVQNIVLNAKQAIKDVGTIKVSVQKLQNYFPNKKTTGLSNWIKITFKDDGPGIPASIKPNIMKPYYTTKSDGNGLGLATTLEIIQNHKGCLRFDSEEGKGTRFDVYLPIQEIDC